jgi:hypothetical protein
MKSKVIEIRDAGTFIPALAIQLGSENEQERWLLSSAGYGRTFADQSRYVFLAKIAGGSPCKGAIDPFEWGQNLRTYFVAHQHIVDHFEDLEEGAVVDVEYILGLRPTPKTSDRYAEAR